MPTAQFWAHVLIPRKNIHIKQEWEEWKEEDSNYQVVGAESIRRSHSPSLPQNNVGGSALSLQIAPQDAEPQFSFQCY